MSEGSTEWVYWISKITEDPISHGNFSLEITYKMSKKGVFDQANFCHRIKYLSQKIFVTEKTYVTDKKFISQKQASVTKSLVREKN